MTTNGQGLLSPSDVAELADVKRPVVSNWRKRHADFPAAVAGTEAKPLFARTEIIDWLKRRGYEITAPAAGSEIWAVANSIRDVLSLESAGELILALACLRSRAAGTPHDSLWRSVVDAGPDVVYGRLVEALREVRVPFEIRNLEQFNLLGHRSRQTISALARTINDSDPGDLAEAVDFALERLSRWQIKGGGEAGFIGSRTSALLASLAENAGGTIYDPACGIAAVLIKIADRGSSARLVGHDISESAIRTASQRALLHRAVIDLLRIDVLAGDPDPDLLADVVVAEPPFGMTWDPSAVMADPRFAYGLPPKTSSDLAWVQHAIAHLASGGRAYVLTSPGALFRSGSERQVRSNLLSAGCVEAIIALPPKMLPHTSIPLALWVLRKPEAAAEVLLVDASDVDNVEHQVATWLSHHRVGAPHSRVAITDLLAADAVLLPAKWVGELRVDAEAIAASFIQGSAAIARTSRALGRRTPDFEQLADLPRSRIATVRELVDAGVVDLRLGRRERVGNLDMPEDVRVVKASDVKSGVLPPVSGPAYADHPDVTEPGDVLVTTMHEIRAVVDRTGGHLPSTGVDRLRVLDRSTITPSYVAAVITGSWNARMQTGTTIQRAPIRDLEIPLIPKTDQHLVETAQADLTSVRELAEALTTQAHQVQAAILDALRYNVPLRSTDAAGQSGDAGDDDKGAE
ncbi:MAG: N-6 DNA methylase [Streptosporangiaceae bacterium]